MCDDCRVKLRPFERMPYADLPELPRRPHPFADARAERVVVETPHFGELGLACRRYGQGPPLVCIHGLMTTSYSFRYILEPLRDRFEVVMFDLPGAGDSDKPDVAYGPREVADALAAAMKAAGAWGAPVLGNSMGGYLSMWLALRHPGAAARVLNLHSPGVVTARMRALDVAFHVPVAPRIVDWLVRRDPERWVFENVHYYDESLKSREEARAYAAPLRSSEGRRAFARHLGDTLAVEPMRAFEARLRELGGELPVPLLLVYARQDPMVPPEVGRRLSAMVPGARLVWLDEASHFAHVDATDRFLEVALPFLSA
jgi:pimeloyl-ACP methyl ester carboxylesterase